MNRAVDTRISRRSFLASASATLAVASSARLRAARVPASDRVVVGVVGWGMQGPNNTKAFLQASQLPGGRRMRYRQEPSANGA